MKIKDWVKDYAHLFEDEINKDILIDRIHKKYHEFHQTELNEKLFHKLKSKKGDLHE